MGFRNPITTAVGVDTRSSTAPAGVQVYVAANPDGTGTAKGIVEWDDGVPGDLPARAVQTVAPPAGPRSMTDPFGRLTFSGGRYAAGGSLIAAPDFSLGVEQGTTGPLISPQARINGASGGFIIDGPPSTTAAQGTNPGSLVRYDSVAAALTPISADFTGPANGVVNGTLTNIPNGMSRTRAAGPTTLAVPASGATSLPAGLWLVTWEIALSGGTINGRSFLEALNGATILARAPLYDVGEDTVSGSFFFALTATTSVTFQFFLTLTASPFNTTHTLRLARLGNAS